ncbi:MAG: hypothetical protein JOZ17_03190, partial [Acetobacteraceae bacterium]|nr:hypothetical protein [Acetobacteraceae bacterium]
DRADASGQRVISISYLGMMREAAETGEAQWRSSYRYFPWEDHRTRQPPMIRDHLAPSLQSWARLAPDARTRRSRDQRLSIAFGLNGCQWDEELVVQRYELLFEAGLVAEAQRRPGAPQAPILPGDSMAHDHRRILATGIARLRAKIKYRPVVFELMPPSFTLLQLQRAVEALAGRLLHKQNFRRLIEQQELVEETGKIATETGGRPAKLFRFRRQVFLERAVAGTKLPLARP